MSTTKSQKNLYIGGAILVVVIVLASAYAYYTSMPKGTTMSTSMAATSAMMATSGGMVFTANLVSSEEVPANTSPATGKATVTISPDGSSLHFVVEVANMQNVTLAHIHLAAKGQNGPVVVPFYTGPVKPGSFTGTLAQGDATSSNLVGPLAGKTISDLVQNIKSGNCYVNVHNSAHPGGEIRGQLS